MPRGPRGEKRPADVIGNAVKVMRIATGEAGARKFGVFHMRRHGYASLLGSTAPIASLASVKNVCDALDIKNPSDAYSRLDRDDLGTTEGVDKRGRKHRRLDSSTQASSGSSAALSRMNLAPSAAFR